ncbi:MAG: GNAT family N-acetyltransferase [Lachnospiraceae bacterium]
MIQRLTEEYFEQVYELLEKSFPIDEYRTYEEQKELLLREEYRVYGMINQENDQSSGQLQAFIALWECRNFTFIEHFAVNPVYRNTGMGAAILQEILPKLPGPVCLEVELPQNELASRRIGFYQRNGFILNDYPYMQPPISQGRNPLPLKIMTWGKGISEEQFQRIQGVLYREVYGVRDDKM